MLGCLLLSVSFTLFSHQDLKQKSDYLPSANISSDIFQAKADYLALHYILQIKLSHFSQTKNEISKGLVKVQTFFDNHYFHKMSHFYIETDLLFSYKTVILACIASKDEPFHPIRI
jgi:hypothetical protein